MFPLLNDVVNEGTTHRATLWVGLMRLALPLNRTPSPKEIRARDRPKSPRVAADPVRCPPARGDGILLKPTNTIGAIMKDTSWTPWPVCPSIGAVIWATTDPDGATAKAKDTAAVGSSTPIVGQRGVRAPCGSSGETTSCTRIAASSRGLASAVVRIGLLTACS